MPRIEHYSGSVVLADDDKDHALLFRKVLQSVAPEKHLTAVEDGEKLLALLSAYVPDLLFLDLNMPFRHGLECLQEIRSMPHLRDMKVVVYTSSTEVTDIRKCFIQKADLYMVKPFHYLHQVHALKAVLNYNWKDEAAPRYYINNNFMPHTGWDSRCGV